MPHTAWGPYPDTVLVLPEAGIEIDLRRPLTTTARRALADSGLGGPFAVVTACNPLGRSLESASNLRLAAVLTALVRDRHPPPRRVDGRSPDGRHIEPGWALSLPLEAAKAIAARFFQNALFWYDGERFHLVPVLAAGQRVALPVEPVAP